jgi:hypothetical protein
VFFSSHLDEIERVCDHVAMIRAGASSSGAWTKSNKVMTALALRPSATPTGGPLCATTAEGGVDGPVSRDDQFSGPLIRGRACWRRKPSWTRSVAQAASQDDLR